MVYQTSNFEEIKKYVKGLYERIPNAREADIGYWQRIDTLNNECKGKLLLTLQFQSTDKQVPLPTVKATVDPTGEKFSKDQGTKDVPAVVYDDSALDSSQATAVRALRSNALIIHSTAPCRIGGDGGGEIKIPGPTAGEFVELPKDPAHVELLFVLELSTGDAAELLRGVNPHKPMIAEVPSYWVPILHGVGYKDVLVTKRPRGSGINFQYLYLDATIPGKEVVVFPSEPDPLFWGPGNVEEFKTFPITSFEDARKIHNRLVAARKQWKQMLITANEQQKAALISSPPDKAAKDAADAQIRDVHKSVQEFEAAFRIKIAAYRDSARLSLAQKKQLNEWLVESSRVGLNYNLWPVATTPGTVGGTTGNLTIPQTPVPETKASPDEVARIMQAFETKKTEFDDKEKKAKADLKVEIDQNYANAQTKHDALVKITNELQAIGQEERYRGQVRQARECFHSAMAATVESQTPNRTSAELGTVRDILVLNNSCLDRYLSTFRVYEKEAAARFKTTEQMSVQQKFVAMQSIARSADDAIRETKVFMARQGFYDPDNTYKTTLADMEAKRQALGLLLTATGSDLTLDDVTKRETEAKLLRDDIVKNMIFITTAAQDDLPSVLLMQQLKGSQADLAAAKRRASESAALAAEHQRQAELSQRAQDTLLQRAQFAASPYRSVGAARTNLTQREENLIEKTRLDLRLLVDNVNTAVDTNNARNNLVQLLAAMKRIERPAEALNARTHRLTDILEEVQLAKARAEEMLHRKIVEPDLEEEEDEEEEEEGDEEEEEKEDVVAMLREAVDAEDIDNLEMLIEEVEEEQLRLGEKLPGAAKWVKAARKLLKNQ